MPQIDQYLEIMVQKDGSDLHICQGNPPLIRVHGELEPVTGIAPVDSFDEMVLEILEPHQKQKFLDTGDVDSAYSLGAKARFRVNVFRQKNGIGACLRMIPVKIRSMQEMNLPAIVDRFVNFKRGLALVTGPTGSGKSTTLAAILDAINQTRRGHIITIEEPLEFIHPNKTCLITHREVGLHAKSFADAVKAALRENPDVILIGEMRDIETMSMALAASETGILVFGTLHTNNASKTIDRLVDSFPEKEQDMVRGVLAENLQGVISQQLLRTVSGKGRVAALEIMFGTQAIGNLIREGKTPQISSALQSSGADGMVPLDKSLAELVLQGKIDLNEAKSKAIDQDYFQKLVNKN